MNILRNLETFFLSKRFLIYNHKPEYILREVMSSLPPVQQSHFQDTAELRSELVRKDELIRKHYDKLGQVSKSPCLPSPSHLHLHHLPDLPPPVAEHAG